MLRNFKSLFIVTLLAFSQFALGAGSISFMTYNVENLFDTTHDEGKEDHTYLPLEMKRSPQHKKKCNKLRSKRWRRQCLKWDWSQKTVDTKMERIAKVILSQNNGRGPDVVFLEEVENINILKQLVHKHMPEAGYQTVELIEGVDKRGIDPAIISRFPLAKPSKLHAIPFSAPGGREVLSRGILEVNLKIPQGGSLTAFAVHFPSPGNPNILRRQAMTFLNELGREAARTSQIVIAAGDFNVTLQQDSKIYRGLASPLWHVSHYVGCSECNGTNYFFPKDTWSFLDAILVFKNPRILANFPRWELEKESINIPSNSPHQSKNKKPSSFEVKSLEGISDHFPIILKMETVSRDAN